jgi:hypothetical protein
MSSNDFSNEFNTDSNVIEVLDELAERVRVAHKAVQTASANALAAALVAGDALIEAKNHRVGLIGWEGWVKAHCRVGLSTARLYMQLARGRAKIEAALKDNPLLSLREARRLLAKPKNPEPEPDQEPEESELLVVLKKTPDAETAAVLVRMGLAWFRRVMPAEWRVPLEQFLASQALGQLRTKFPNTRIKNLGHKHLKLAVSNPEAPTTH